MNPQNQVSAIPLPFKIFGGVVALAIACLASICAFGAMLPTPPNTVPQPQVTAPPMANTNENSGGQPVPQPQRVAVVAPQPVVPSPPTAPTPDVPPARPPLPDGYHAMGETWRLGCCEYTANTAMAQNRVGSSFAVERADPGVIFVVLRFTETNLSDETVHAMGGNVQLIDHRGRHFDESSRVMTAIEMSERTQMLPELQPNVPHRGIAGFEVPSDIVDGPLDFRFTERGMLGTDTATVRTMSGARARNAIHPGG